MQLQTTSVRGQRKNGGRKSDERLNKQLLRLGLQSALLGHRVLAGPSSPRARWHLRGAAPGQLTGGKARLPVYNDDYGQLDASVSYTFLDNYTVTAEASNLLQEKTVGIIDQNAAGDHVAYSYAQDARFAVGVRAKF